MSSPRKTTDTMQVRTNQISRMRANHRGRVGRRPARGAAALARVAVVAGGKIFGPGKVAAVRNPTPRLVAPILRRPSSGRRPEVKGTGAVGGGAASSEHVRPVYLEPAAGPPHRRRRSGTSGARARERERPRGWERFWEISDLAPRQGKASQFPALAVWAGLIDSSGSGPFIHKTTWPGPWTASLWTVLN